MNGAEMLAIAVVALIVVGPQRLPTYAAQLRAAATRVRDVLKSAQDGLREEIGVEELSQLDPRQYDPRHIVREALADDEPGPRTEELGIHRPTGVKRREAAPRASGVPAPFDTDAT